MTILKNPMQYNLDQLAKDSTVKLTWHGEDTRVLVDGEGEKRDVKAGDTLEVSVEQAKTLLKYSHKWTLEGDTPIEQPFEKAQKAAHERQAAIMKKRLARRMNAGKPESAEGAEESTDGEGAEDAVMPLTEADVDAMDTKKEILAALKARKVKANKNADVSELKSLLKENLAPATESTDGEGADEDEETKE